MLPKSSMQQNIGGFLYLLVLILFIINLCPSSNYFGTKK